MILTCPDCSTRYSVKDDAVGPKGRNVRCSNCSTTWFVSSDPDALLLKDNETDAAADSQQTSEAGFSQPDLVPSGLGAHVAMRDMTDQRRRSRRLFSVSLIWGVTLAILAAAAVLGYVFRQEVVNIDPRSATIYKAFGIEVTQSGLTFENAVTRSLLVDGQPVLVVNGAVRNSAGNSKTIPLVELSLHSQDGDVLAGWVVEVDTLPLSKGKRVEFSSQYPNPPIDAVSLRYQFAGETAVLEGGETPVPIIDEAASLRVSN